MLISSKHNTSSLLGGKLHSLFILLLIIFTFLGFTLSGTKSHPESPEYNFNSETGFFNSVSKILADSTDSTSSDSLGIVDSLGIPDSLVSDSTMIDSVEIDPMLLDSLGNIDPLKIDSTARMKYFHYQRQDNYSAQIRQKKPSAFFIQPSPRHYTRTVELDSTGQYVLIKEKVAGQFDKVYLKIPLEEYIEMRTSMNNRELWEKLGYKYETTGEQNDLGQLLSDITNIEIPLPSAGFLSIFGPNIIKLRINGSVDIHGAWRNETTEGLTASRLGNSRNEPDFSQQVQISVNGTIGDKLKINADWNTERTFEYENQLKIVYDGYEDEIVKKVEAGNVSLQTSPLVGGSEALFGIKSQFQFGPFSLTALASQKKGEVTEVNLSGGSQSQTFEVHAYDYSENHYFLDEVYANSNYFNRIFRNQIIPGDEDIQQNRITDIEVWRSTTQNVDEGSERFANLFIDLPPGPIEDSLRSEDLSEDPGKIVAGVRMKQMILDRDYSYNSYAGFITFSTQIQDNDIIGVAYRIQGDGTIPDRYGEFITELPDSGRIVLKLIKPQSLTPKFKTAWKLQLRNIYYIGGRDVREEGFSLDINYRVEGQEPRTDYDGYNLLRVFGLDRYNASSEAKPDGAFDFNVGYTILPETGEIIFPVLEPFGADMPQEISSADLQFNEVYDTLKSAARKINEKDKFTIVGEYSASVTSTFNIGFNVVENSVRVQLNGADLKEGPDYAVDYNIGQVTIRNAAALVPGADLKITYEQNDLFSLASKTLLGFRGLYEFDKNTKLGFSYLNLNQKTLSDKVRIGEEPLNNSIYGVDFQTDIDLPFVTKGLDYFISTRANSSLNVKGEFAYMSPDPNTKKSTISGDNSESIAYIDDFEGSKRIIPIGVSYTAWKDLSPPFQGNNQILDSLMAYKAKSFWFNILPSDVVVTDIWPKRQAGRQDQQVTVLDFVFRPNTRGTYNNNPRIDENHSQNWGGMMKFLSSTASNLVEDNIEFIEFWAQIRKMPDGAKIFIDIGKISEDVIPNGVLDDEEEGTPNELLENEGDDKGLDFKSDSEEEGSAPGTDKSGDNFRIVPGSVIVDDYLGINGTEGNAQSTDLGRLPDTEDLNRTFTLDRLNSFYRYEVPLDTSIATNPFIGGGGETDWYQFKIPLKDFALEINQPSFEIVEFMRIWIQGVEEEVHLRIADLNFVGNQWEKNLDIEGVTEEDEVLTVTTINIEDNPNTYITPPGVKRERDRSKPDEEVYKNEQSLELQIRNMLDGEYREVVKNLYRPLDVFNYTEMKLFIRGDEGFELPSSISYYEDSTNYGSEVYFRFGADNSNFYEYRQPLQYNLDPGSQGWDEISIKFSDLTAIKEKRVADTTGAIFTENVPGREGHKYGIKGNPTLTRISYFTIGVENPASKGDTAQTVTGNVWINELRVLGADDTPGWAYSVSTSLKLADLLTVNFNTKQTDPYFHKLNDRFGSRVDNKSWSVNANLDVMKLIPADMEGSNLKVNYSHSESYSKPLYKPGTDVLVDAAAAASSNPDSLKRETETISIKDTWSLSNIKFVIPTDAWYIDETINNLSFGFNYNKSFSRNPTVRAQRSWLWDAKVDYSLNLGRDNYFYPADIPIFGDLLQLFEDYRNVKVYYTPASVNTNLSARRNWNFTQSRTLGREPDIQRDFTASRGGSFNWTITDGGLINLGIDYSTDATSSLAYLLTEGDQERSEADIWRDVFSGAFFGRDNSFRQAFGLKTNPKLPSLLDLNRFLKVTFGYRVTYNWKNNFQQEELGRSANYTSNLNAGINLRLKSIMDPILGDDDKSTINNNRGITSPRNTRGRNQPRTQNKRAGEETDEEIDVRPGDNDSTAVADSLEGESRIMQILGIMKGGFKYLLFDYEQISFNFSQSNSRGGGGLLGTGSGFNNFWGIRQQEISGPSRLFMLGLSNELGGRVGNATLQETFSQKNNFDFKTSRPLWEGAKIDLSWKVGWGFNRNTTIQTDSIGGDIMITNVTSSGNIDRSFFSVPIPFFNSNLKRVNELYDPEAEDQNKNLSEAFVTGLESFPLISKIPILKDVAKFVPRPNWRINWSGLEKLALFEGIAKSVRLEHAYTSNFNEGWKINSDGVRETQSQKISYGFSPLLGLNVTFDEFWGGNLNTSIKYNLKTNFDLGLATKNVTESLSNDISLTASFSKSGFEIPLFGLSLKNDIEVSFSYTMGKNSVVVYELGDAFTEEGKPQDGTTRITMEPRIKYVMSARVTLSLFYKRSSVEPEGASRIPPTTTNEAGLDVHISIQ